MKTSILAAVTILSLVSQAVCGEVKAAPTSPVQWSTAGNTPKTLVEATCSKGNQMHYEASKTNDVSINVKDRQGNNAWVFCKNEKTGKTTTASFEVLN